MATPVVIATDQDNVLSMAADGTNVYWITTGTANSSTPTGTVAKVPAAGGTVTVLAPGLDPVSIAVGTNNVFFAATDTPDGIIAYVPIAGGKVTSVLTSTTSSNEYDAFAIGSTEVYFIDGEKIESVPHSGGTPKTLIALTGTPSLNGIAVDATSVYWTERKGAGSTGGSVNKIPLAGAASATVLASGLNTPTTLRVDATNAYWIDSNAQTISTVPLAGGTPTVLASGSNANPLDKDVYGPVGIAIDANNVYWANSGNANVMSVPIAGGTPTVLAQGVAVVAMTADATSVYWANGGGGPTNGGTSFTGTINKVAK
jgi:hypothetical protein